MQSASSSNPSVPVRTLRNDVATILNRVASGETIDVTRHGVRVAQLCPPDDSGRALTVAEFLRFRRSMPVDREFATEVREQRDADHARDPYERWGG